MVTANLRQQTASGSIQAVRFTQPSKQRGMALMAVAVVPAMAVIEPAADDPNGDPGQEKPEKQLPARNGRAGRRASRQQKHIQPRFSVDAVR